MVKCLALDYGGVLTAPETNGADHKPVDLTAAKAVKAAASLPVKLILASNTTERNAPMRRPALAKAGIAGYFGTVLLSTEIRVAKPDSRFYAAVLHVACCEPDQVVFIDNRARNVRAAVDVGMRGVLIDQESTEPAVPGAPMLGHLSELPNLFRSWGL